MSITCQNIIDGGQQKRCGHCPPRAFNPAGKKAIMKADMYMNQTMKRGGGTKHVNTQQDLAQGSEKDSFDSDN